MDMLDLMKKSRRIADLKWARIPQQARSRKTLTALLLAAEKTFAEKGMVATTIADIAKTAGCSVGSVYHHFRDKAALVSALFDIRKQEFLATLDDAVAPERWEGASIGEILQGYLEFSIDTPITEQPISFEYVDPNLRAEIHNLHQRLFERLRALLTERIDEVNHPRPLAAIEFILDQLRATLLLHHKRGPIASFLSLSDDEVVEEALEMACEYLKVEKPQ